MIEIVHDDAMKNDRVTVMQSLLASDPEAWARLSGVMAILALPHVAHADRTTRAQLIEIEVQHNVWEHVDRVTITPEAIIFAHGVNGHTKRWPFSFGDIPRWRMAETTPKHLASLEP